MRFIFLALAACLTGTTLAQTGDTWTPKANYGPGGTAFAVCFVIGSKVYVGTGLNSSGTPKRDFWEYDPANDTWTQKANFGGVARQLAFAFSIGSKGYVGGGLNTAGNGVADFWEYDPANDTWTQKANYTGASPARAAAFAVGSKGYVHRGGDQYHEYNPTTNTWTKLSGSGTRYTGIAFSIGTKGYIGLGQDINATFRRDLFEYYDPSDGTNGVAQKASMPASADARAHAKAFVLGSKAYVCGGYLNNGSGVSEIWEFDADADVWTQRSNFVDVRWGGIAFTVNGKGYFGMGKRGTTTSVYLSDFYEYTPPTAASIAASTVAAGPFCPGETVAVSFAASGNFSPGNQFTAQLSDAAGNFAAPANMGTLTSTTSGTISATLPANAAAGTGYRIRVVANGPSTIGADNGSNIALGQAYTYYADADGDNYYPAGANSALACAEPNGYAPAANSNDCNDASAAIHPAAQETCDNLDNDCDGLTDQNDPSNLDNAAPTAQCRTTSAFMDDFGIAAVTPAMLNNRSTDNCSTASALSLSVSPSSVTCTGSPTATVVLTVTDESGQSSTCSATVSILDNPSYQQSARHSQSDGNGGACFGWSLSLDNGLLAAGAPSDRIGSQPRQGSAHVFSVGADHSTTFLRKITASDGQANSFFGNALALDGSALLVAASKKTVNSQPERGAAYIFYQNQGGANAWGEVKQLSAADGAAGDWLGHAVSLKNDVAAIGAPNASVGTSSKQGAAYLFGKDFGNAENWGMVKKLTAADGARNDFFGMSVAQSDDWVLIGANGNRFNKGAAYLFRQNTGGTNNWGQVKKLTASDESAGDTFGSSVSMSGNYALIGSPNHNFNRGAAYIFKKGSGGESDWSQAKKLTAPGAQPNQRFGLTVYLVGDLAYVGTYKQDGNTGAFYVFYRNEGGTDNWGHIGTHTASDGRIGDQFSFALAADVANVFVSANFDHVGTKKMQGSVYQFDALACGGVPRPSEVGNREAETEPYSSLKNLEITCHPTPVRDYLMVDISSISEAQLQLLDATGRVLAEADLPAGTSRFEWLETANLPAGLYVARVVSGAEWQATLFSVVK